MKVLLINPNSSLISKSWAYRKFFTPIAPLGLAYLASTLEKNNIEVSIIDQFATKIPDKELFALIKKESPSVVGISVLTPVLPDARNLAVGIRATNPGIKIIFGNIHSTCFPDQMLNEGLADIVVRGEGELTFLETCQKIAENKGLSGVAGISFKTENRVVHNPERGIVEDLDSLPFPAWHLLRPDDYTEVPLAAISKARAFPIMASRGCTSHCYYCSQDKIYKKMRLRDLNKVVDEMEYFFDRLSIRFFGFSDSYFPFDEKSGLAFCDLLIKRRLHKKLRWCTETRVDKVTRPLLEAMKESGAHLIMYGVEVGNEKILNSLNKHTTLEQARQAFRETRRAGILSQGLFILGLPGETTATCRDTINFSKELDCDIVKFNIAMPYPGSLFFEDQRKSSANHKPEKFTSWFDWTHEPEDLVYTPEGMTSATLRQMQRRAMLEFYLRPKIMIRHFLKGSISFKNIFYGGIWLITLFFTRKNKRSAQ